MDSTEADSDRYRLLFDNSIDPMFVIDGVSNRVIDCNLATIQLLRYQQKSDLIGLRPWELSPAYQSDGLLSELKAQQILLEINEKKSCRFEWVHQRKNGELFYVDVSLTAIDFPTGHVVHAVWKDITDKKRLQNELTHAQKMGALKDLSAGIAHDFSNTLTPIITYSELILEKLEESNEIHHWAGEIQRAATLAASCVRKLMGSSRKQEHKPAIFNLVSRVQALLDLASKGLGEDIELEFSTSEEELPIYGDPADVDFVLLNLFSNARDAMPSGGQLNIAICKVEMGGRQIAKLSVTDSGIGMGEDTIQQIFTPFFTTKEIGRGTGLGLALVYQVIKTAGGDVHASSEIGVGTTFEVSLPLVCEQSPSKLVGQNRSPTTVVSPSHAKALVVDDDEIIRRMVKSVLVNKGFAVVTADSIQEAIKIAGSEDLTIIVSDVILHGENGIELKWWLQRSGIHTPILFMSGYSSDKLEDHGFETVSDRLLEKPFSANELLGKVNDLVKIEHDKI